MHEIHSNTAAGADRAELKTEIYISNIPTAKTKYTCTK